MRMGAIVWAGISRVIWGTSIKTLTRLGIPKIAIPASTVAEAAIFYHPEVVGRTLEKETDKLFAQREMA